MYYFRKGMQRAVAEKDANAARLIAEGWEPCSPAVHEALWRRADVVQRMERAECALTLIISRKRFFGGEAG